MADTKQKKPGANDTSGLPPTSRPNYEIKAEPGVITYSKKSPPTEHPSITYPKGQAPEPNKEPRWKQREAEKTKEEKVAFKKKLNDQKRSLTAREKAQINKKPGVKMGKSLEDSYQIEKMADSLDAKGQPASKSAWRGLFSKLKKATGPAPLPKPPAPPKPAAISGDNKMNEKKQELLQMVRLGKQRPETSTPLGHALANYMDPNSYSFDPKFSAIIERMAPSWLEKNYDCPGEEMMKSKGIFDVLGRNKKKPDSRTRDEKINDALATQAKDGSPYAEARPSVGVSAKVAATPPTKEAPPPAETKKKDASHLKVVKSEGAEHSCQYCDRLSNWQAYRTSAKLEKDDPNYYNNMDNLESKGTNSGDNSGAGAASGFVFGGINKSEDLAKAKVDNGLSPEGKKAARTARGDIYNPTSGYDHAGVHHGSFKGPGVSEAGIHHRFGDSAKAKEKHKKVLSDLKGMKKSEDLEKARVDEGKSQEQKERARDSRNNGHVGSNIKGINKPSVPAKTGEHLRDRRGQSHAGLHAKAAHEADRSDSERSYNKKTAVETHKHVLNEMKTMPKPKLEKATGHEKGVNPPSPTVTQEKHRSGSGYTTAKGRSVAGEYVREGSTGSAKEMHQKTLTELKRMKNPKLEKATGHEKGINKPVHSKVKDPVKSTAGMSEAGAAAREKAAGSSKAYADYANSYAKNKHKQILSEMKEMPKPKLEKATGHEKGVHQPMKLRPGVSRAGSMARIGHQATKNNDKAYGESKEMHREKLDELKSMPKPKLEKHVPGVSDKKMDSCVKDVKAKGDGNAYAICTSSLKKMAQMAKGEPLEKAKNYVPQQKVQSLKVPKIPMPKVSVPDVPKVPDPTTKIRDPGPIKG